jgi:hypothetical protein
MDIDLIKRSRMGISSPLLMLVWIGVCIFWTGFCVTTYNRYEDNLCIRKTKEKEDIAFYEEYCKDPQKVVAFRLAEECERREHSTHRSPERFAIVDTFNEIGLCYGTRCEDLFARSAFVIPLAVVVPTLVFLIIMICGCNIARSGLFVDRRQSYPYSYSTPHKKE